MIVLAIDTSTPVPSLALARGAEPIITRMVVAEDGAGRRVAQEIHALLGDAGMRIQDVERIVVGVGPGGFTGLRIGMASALALAQALDIPATGVCSLETLALGMARVEADGVLVPVIDARRREVFTAAYRVDGGGLVTLQEPRAVAADGFAEMLSELPGDVVVAGDGVHRIEERLAASAVVIEDPAANRVDASASLSWALRDGARPVAPLYLRLPDAEVNRRLREGEKK